MRLTVPRRRLAVGLSGAAIACLGCGGSAEQLSAGKVPLAPGARVSAQHYGCPAVPEVCFRWALVEAPAGSTSRQLKAAERRVLISHGWHFRAGSTRSALAADAPKGDLFISFETGAEQLADDAAGRSLWAGGRVGDRLRRTVAIHRAVLAVTLEPPPSAQQAGGRGR
jgi:hypothetical protein